MSLVFIVVSIIAIYILSLAIFYVMQEKMIFAYFKIAKDFEFDYEFDYKEFWVEVDKDISLHGLEIVPENPEILFIYFHGRKGHMARSGNIYNRLETFNAAVYLFDYRGYGKSGGSISSSQQFLDDSLTVYDAIVKKHPNLPVVLYGHSMGNTPALFVANHRHVDKLVLENPFYNLKRIVKKIYWYIPTHFVLKYTFPNDLLIEEISKPILLLHGVKDEVVPFKHAEELAQKNTIVQLCLVDEGGHNDLADFPLFHDKLQQFILARN